MKKIIIALNLVLLLSVAGFGQKNKTEPNTVDGDATRLMKSKPAKNGNADKSGKVMLDAGANLQGELQKTLDVKNVSVGEEVVLKVTQSIKQNGETIVPKGTRLIGKVTEVQQKTKETGMSKIGVLFDQIQGKNLNAPINASIVSITQAANVSGGGMIDSDISGASSSSGSASAGSSSGGGLLGGVGKTVGGVLNTTTSTVGGVANTAGNTVGGATNTLSSTVKGISLSQSANASAQGSTTLSAQGKNVRLEKGVVFGIRLNESIEYR